MDTEEITLLLADSIGALQKEEAGVEQASPAEGEIAPVELGQRVLIVDDNEDVALVLGDVLRAFGHEVRVAHDGAAALAALEDFHPQVALLDIGLPVMDGYELADRIRQRLGEDAPRLIAVSGYGTERIARTREAGFAEHLVKPVDVERVLDAIRRHESRMQTIRDS